MPVQFIVQALPNRVSEDAMEEFLAQYLAPRLQAGLDHGGKVAAAASVNIVVPDGNEEVVRPALIVVLEFPPPETIEVV